MRVQLQNISGHQTAKIIAYMLVIFMLPFALIGLLGFLSGTTLTATDDEGAATSLPWLFMVFAPVAYGVLAYLFNRLTFWVYNLLATRAGGIEFTLEEQG